MTGVSFAESFWDTDYTGSAGWDILCRRMKDGKKVCSEAAYYFKSRAKAELEYSKALNNIAKKTNGKEETGVLGQGWRDLKAQTEEIANAHNEAGNHFNNLFEELTRFNDDQTKSKQAIEENVKRGMANKKSEYDKTMHNKKNYEQKCRDYDAALESNRTLHQAVTVTKKELEKAQNKEEKCKSSRDNADLAYKSSVENLEAARKSWESQMEQACKEFEGLEISRMQTLRDKIWKSANIDSLTCVRHDECCEKIRDKLEICDILTDIQEFIEINKTGSQRPAPIEYENYYKDTVTPSSKNINNRPPMRPPQMGLPQLPPHNTTPYVTAHIGEGAYATVDIMTPQQNTSKVYMKIVCSHMATSPSELTVNEGDIVEYVNRRENLLTVKLQNQRRVGIIPASCAVKYLIKESTFL